MAACIPAVATSIDTHMSVVPMGLAITIHVQKLMWCVALQRVACYVLAELMSLTT